MYITVISVLQILLARIFSHKSFHLGHKSHKSYHNSSLPSLSPAQHSYALSPAQHSYTLSPAQHSHTLSPAQHSYALSPAQQCRIVTFNTIQAFIRALIPPSKVIDYEVKARLTSVYFVDYVSFGHIYVQ